MIALPLPSSGGGRLVVLGPGLGDGVVEVRGLKVEAGVNGSAGAECGVLSAPASGCGFDFSTFRLFGRSLFEPFLELLDGEVIVHAHAVGMDDAAGVLRVIAVEIAGAAEGVDVIERFVSAAEYRRLVARELAVPEAGS